MADVRAELARREQAKRDRAKKIAEGTDVPRVRVLPKNDDVRRTMAHGATGARFPQGGGSVEWPDDQFTKRRVRDGDVIIEQAQSPEQALQQRQTRTPAPAKDEPKQS